MGHGSSTQRGRTNSGTTNTPVQQNNSNENLQNLNFQAVAEEETIENIVQSIRELFPEGSGLRTIDGIGFYIADIGRPSTISFADNENYFLFPNQIIRTDESWMIDENSHSMNRQELNDLRSRLREAQEQRNKAPRPNPSSNNSNISLAALANLIFDEERQGYYQPVNLSINGNLIAVVDGREFRVTSVTGGNRNNENENFRR